MIKDGEDICFQKTKLEAPTKITTKLLEFVDDMTKANPRLSNLSLSVFANQSGKFNNNISESTIMRARKILEYRFSYPLISFALTEKQKSDSLSFAQKHLQLGTDWTKVLFTDESYFWLNEDHRPLYRKKGEKCPGVIVTEKKFPDKVLVFGGISSQVKTNLIISEKGTIDHVSYVDELIDGSGLIPHMNEVYGIKGWILMQDGATAHTCRDTIYYLRMYVNILVD
ncbi:Transposable element Tcb2 transposase [Histomonas meleagridis]|uniref:Transposable element Tcb2 transposase n=1 Tax=Histomonas meleagridis TaxID=135588 RepID=UPI003559F860|nr:Transposable element Tcb2 transposase [Histomonas meleagridis]KAH0804827.1 Transposable element Tcb2 transposase [Histomonas meleagridis]